MVGKGNLRWKKEKENQKYVFDPVHGEKSDHLKLNIDLANWKREHV